MYQECLVRVMPQKLFDPLMNLCRLAAQRGYYETSPIAPLSVITLKKDLGETEAGTKVLWVCGSPNWMDGKSLIGRDLPDVYRDSAIDFIPVVEFLRGMDEDIFYGLDTLDYPTSNEYMRRESIESYALGIPCGAPP